MGFSPECVNGLVQTINNAFDKVAYPGDEQLASAGGELELRRFYGRFVGKHWSQVPGELLENSLFALSFFSPLAYQFFLPSYMVQGVCNFDDPQSGVLEFTVYSLTPPDDPGDLPQHDYFRQQKRELTKDQKHAVLEFLQTVRDEGTFTSQAESAIRRYWGDF